MYEVSTTSDTRDGDQADEEILNDVVSDDALEAAAEMERGVATGFTAVRTEGSGCNCCVGKALG